MNARFGNLAGRGPVGQKQPKAKPDPAYLARVRELPCVVCDAFGEPQYTPTAAHHCIHGRYSQRKAPDYAAIPLCADHHQHGGNGKVALHAEPTKWKRLYGQDHEYIEVTQDKLGWTP
jgi:hypothetical protein